MVVVAQLVTRPYRTARSGGEHLKDVPMKSAIRWL